MATSTLKTALLAAVVAIAASVLTLTFMPPKNSAGEAPKPARESAYERVMRTGVLRCGYVPYGIANIIDPNTGEQSGIVYEIMNRIGELLKVKVEWTEEVSWATFVQGLKLNRFDVACAAVWLTPDVVNQVEFSDPYYFVNLGTWVRSDDTRFDQDLSLANSDKVTIAALDGSMPVQIAREDFPKAKVLSMPDNLDYGTILLNISNKKADISFVEYAVAKEFLAKNPGTIKDITKDRYIRAMANVFGVNKGELELAKTISDAIGVLHSTGEIDKIINKYEKYPNSIARVALPYQSPTQ